MSFKITYMLNIKNKFLRIVCTVLLYIWELPQNLIGLLCLLFIAGETKHKLGLIRFYYAKSFPGGITLGEYIIVGTKQELTVKHEFGHVLQSRYLGPLYLFVIGIPSIIHAGIPNKYCCDKHLEGYYHFYTEKWADKLANVNRTKKRIKFAKQRTLKNFVKLVV